jgi:hypothetical protein
LINVRAVALPVGSQRIGISICSLDDPNAVAPEEQLGTESRVVWLSQGLAAPEASLADWLKGRHITSVGSRQHQDLEPPG